MDYVDPRITAEVNRLLLDTARCEPVSPCVALKQASLAVANGSDQFTAEITRGADLAASQERPELLAAYDLARAAAKRLTTVLVEQPA